MPPVAAAAVAAISSYAASFSITSFLISTASSFALNALSRALAPKPKSLGQQASLAKTRQSITQNVRQAITTVPLVYGEVRVGGSFMFWGSSGNNEFVHFIVALAGNECEAINEVWLNETCIPNDALDAGGNVISGRYNGVVRIKKYLGTDSQTVDSDLNAEFSEVDTDFRLRGISYVYVRLKFNQDAFPSGIPNVSAVVKGKKIYDPRTGLTRFTTNSALFCRDYLTDTLDGFGADPAEIDDTVLIASANACDEIVTVNNVATTVTAVSTSLDTLTLSGVRLNLALGDRIAITSTGTVPGGLVSATNYFCIPYQYKDTPRIRLATTLANAMNNTYIDITSAGSGTITCTKNAEPRYHGSGTISTGTALDENLQDMLSASGAKAIYAGGLWQIKSAIYETPIVTLNESHIISQISSDTKLPRRERFNSIKGVYTASINDFQPSDYPSLVDSAGITADGEQIWVDYDLPFTNRPFTAQRLAKVELKKARQELVVKIQCNLHAMQVQAGSNVMITNARMGWTNKVFEVTEFKFIPIGDEQNPSLSVELTLRETAADIFDWAASEESAIDFAPNTDLPNPWEVFGVTGLSFNTAAITTVQGDTFYNIILSWDAHPDSFVLEGGQFELQYKFASSSDWSPSFFVAGNLNSSVITQGSLGQTYDVRVRAVNNLGVRSVYNTLAGLIVGTSGGVGASNDWEFFDSNPVTVFDDWGAIDATPIVFNDWEGF